MHLQVAVKPDRDALPLVHDGELGCPSAGGDQLHVLLRDPRDGDVARPDRPARPPESGCCGSQRQERQGYQGGVGIAHGEQVDQHEAHRDGGRAVTRPKFSGRRGTLVLLTGSIVMTAMLFAAAYGLSAVSKQHGQGVGHVPWTGVLGIALGGIMLIGLLVAIIRAAVVDHRDNAPA